MFPLPGLTHASNTPAELVASLTIGTAVTSRANATSPPITVRRIQLLVMYLSSLSGGLRRLAAALLK
jgi:hypothetical protein